MANWGRVFIVWVLFCAPFWAAHADSPDAPNSPPAVQANPPGSPVAPPVTPAPPSELLRSSLAKFILTETDVGSELTACLGYSAEQTDFDQLVARLEGLRDRSSFTDELESRLSRIRDRFEAMGGSEADGALSARDRELLEKLAAEELTPLESIAKETYAEQREDFLTGDLTLGREFSALAPPSVSPKNVLEIIRAQRGGTIEPHPTNPGKWVLTDSKGFRWGAEVDGKVPQGGVVYNIIEVQTPPLPLAESKWVDLPLQALLKEGAEPLYSIGGGHIHIDLETYLIPKPERFASLLNFLLSYEELLDYVFSNPTRAHAVQKLSSMKLGDTGATLAAHLGGELNQALKAGRYDDIIGILRKFAADEVNTRDVDINLRSWYGSGAKKTHGTLELRFFNAPKTSQEAFLEDRLVRAMVEFAVKSEANPFLYQPVTDPALGENPYLDDATLTDRFKKMLGLLGLDYPEYDDWFVKRLSDRRHPGH